MTMNIDEFEAFRIARITAHDRGWQWRPPFWISFDEGEWQVHAESECVVRLSAQTGDLVPQTGVVDPLIAMAAAKEYALKNDLSWKPAFSLCLSAEGWDVGACQSQFGGQTNIYVSHHCEVIRHQINPK
jgi:hypothetical protein